MPQSIFPKGDVRFLHPGEVRIYFRDLGIRLDRCERPILGRTVDLILPILAKSPYVGSVFHSCDPSRVIVSQTRYSRASLREFYSGLLPLRQLGATLPYAAPRA
jgi:hypothetical protein